MAGSAFDGIVAKLERANKHIADLKACWVAAREANPGEVASENDAKTGQVTYYVSDLTPIPIEFPLIAGDAIQNMRSALDHLVCGMVVKSKGLSALTRDHAFPIANPPPNIQTPKGAFRDK